MNIQNFISTYIEVRSVTEAICKPLIMEDYVIQSMEDVSPPKWHLAHTTWFFETFILKNLHDYRMFHPLYMYLFNSYYHSIGTPYPRPQRGILARPSVDTIFSYRQYVDQALLNYVNSLSYDEFNKISAALILGLHHEQQHQELLLMDIKHNYFFDIHYPIYTPKSDSATSIQKTSWIPLNGGTIEIGYDGSEFCFDNELPRHPVILADYLIASRLVTNGDYLEFIQDNGYKNPSWWLSDGWDHINQHQIQMPLYWIFNENKWNIFTLNGLQELTLNEPVSHISYYEADAYARWRGARLPSEAEWENYAASEHTIHGNFLESKRYHPSSSNSNQLFGDLWEWTSSSYSPYPGYKPLQGHLSEYNGKFMSNQLTLKGGSCVTPQSHIRKSYRNFFQPDKRWAFTGIRLAKDIEK